MKFSSLAQRKNLVALHAGCRAWNGTAIEIFPTLKRVIPFQSIEEWNKNAERYLAAVKEADENAAPLADDEDDKEEA